MSYAYCFKILFTYNSLFIYSHAHTPPKFRSVTIPFLLKVIHILLQNSVHLRIPFHSKSYTYSYKILFTYNFLFIHSHIHTPSKFHSLTIPFSFKVKHILLRYSVHLRFPFLCIASFLFYWCAPLCWSRPSR